jgi:ATP-dependent RNA helicase DDX3X
VVSGPFLSFWLIPHLVFTGRTARIGNEGLASSFYNDRNEELATELVKILIECKQQVPDFLEGYRPEGDVLDFDDDSDNEASGQKENKTSSQVADEEPVAADGDEPAAEASTQSNWKAAESDDIWN